MAGEKFTAGLHHLGYAFPLVEVDVYPPEFEGSHAKSVSKLDGIVRLQDESGGGPVSQGTKDDIVLFGDIGRIIAWAWLIREGYVETGRQNLTAINVLANPVPMEIITGVGTNERRRAMHAGAERLKRRLECPVSDFWRKAAHVFSWRNRSW